MAGSTLWTSRLANILIFRPIRHCSILEQCSILGCLDNVVRLRFAPKGTDTVLVKLRGEDLPEHVATDPVASRHVSDIFLH